jgi:hypothetical protein
MGFSFLIGFDKEELGHRESVPRGVLFIFWPLMLVYYMFKGVGMIQLALNRKGLELRERYDERKRTYKLAPPECRCNGGTSPCPLPPAEEPFR